MNQVFAEVFPKEKTPPARAVLGVAKLPQPSIQVSAVAVRDLSQVRSVRPPGYKSDEPSRRESSRLTGFLFRACPAPILPLEKFQTIRRPR